MVDDWRVVIAFAAPPSAMGFTRAKSGKCWIRKIEGLSQAKALARQLVDQNIQGVIRKSDRPRKSVIAGRRQASTASGIGAQPKPLAVTAPKSRAGGRASYDQIFSQPGEYSRSVTQRAIRERLP